MPVEPSPSRWGMPHLAGADESGLVAIGADLEPGTLLAAYRHGLFPMPVGRAGPMGWWSPDPRGVVPLDGLQVSRSLRRSCSRYEIRMDTRCADVIDACADPSRPHGWITNDIQAAYVELHRLGWVHSVEAWALDDGELCGGLYGVAIGGLFAGESMFSRRRDASKVCLVHLVSLLQRERATERLLDVQWVTPHLASLGAMGVPGVEYRQRLRRALELPLPDGFARV